MTMTTNANVTNNANANATNNANATANANGTTNSNTTTLGPLTELHGYFINLADKTERRYFMETQLAKYELPWKRFEAITPDKIPPWISERVRAVKSRLSPPVIACASSHITLWQLAVKTGKPVVILEDDTTL